MYSSVESFDCPGQTSVTLDTVKRHLHICAKLVNPLMNQYSLHSELMNTQVDNIQSFSSILGKSIIVKQRFFLQREAIAEVVFFSGCFSCGTVSAKKSGFYLPSTVLTEQLLDS